MPEICRFYGIIIRMYYDDHFPPHFHAFYGEYQAVIRIDTLSVIEGDLPPRAMGLVMEWASLRKKELVAAWEKAIKHQELGKIEPLK